VRVGIVGLPNAGKSTLFNALARGSAETATYPFTTIEPNVAVVPVPDERLEAVADAVGASRPVPETIELVDVAGLVRGAAAGEGLGNQFLAAIRETDAICHVVRCHDAPGVPHPEGRVDPVADAELVEAELRAADLEQAERRLERVRKQARAGDREAAAEALAAFGVAGEDAARDAKGPGSFHVNLYDALAALDPATLDDRAKIGEA
jgi:GTP-binding protein YchF